jgi:hypothetical protein
MILGGSGKFLEANCNQATHFFFTLHNKETSPKATTFSLWQQQKIRY